MKKKFLILPLLLSLIMIMLSFQLKISIHIFDSKQVIKSINTFSSETYKGRLAGSLENEEVATKLKTFMEEENLTPFKGSYFQSFTTKVPYQVDGLPYLKVTNIQGELIKEFQYGEDYKEDMVNFKTNLISFNKNNELSIQDTVIQVGKDSKYFLFYVPKNNSLAFRSSFLETAAHDMYIMLTDTTLSAIKDYLSKGYTISCFIPFETKNMKLNNLAGFIQGSSPNLAPLIISAHFDHIGSDFLGTTYPGALDNASGVAFVMELEKYLNSYGQPERTIIFVFFNAEELGCQGSTAFVKDNAIYLKDSKILNFDMIGSNQDLPLSLMGGGKDTLSDPLLKELSNLCILNNVSYNNLFQDSSDHEAFRKSNIEAVTFCNNDSTRIHTPQDTANFISSKAINNCFVIASTEIIKNAYASNFILLKNNFIFKYSLICFFILLICHILINIEYTASSNK